MAASWEDEKVTQASSNNFVAIKIDTKRYAYALMLHYLLCNDFCCCSYL
jgi:hypothetical protein